MSFLSAFVQEKPDDFEKIMKEMVFEMRGHATDRLKTDDELIKEERERLEEMEVSNIHMFIIISSVYSLCIELLQSSERAKLP